MSVDEQIRYEMSDVGEMIQPDTAAALAHVESAVRHRRNRRAITVAIAASISVAAGLLWAGSSVGWPTGQGDVQPADQPGEWDGGDWIRVEDADFDGSYHFSAVTEIDGRLVAVGEPNGTGPVFTSTDGLDWTPAGTPGTSTSLTGVLRGGLGVIAFGESTLAGGNDGHATVWTSPDGLTWSQADAPDGSFEVSNSWINDVTVGGPGFIAVGTHNDTPAAWTSSDGLEWSLAEGFTSLSGYLTEVMEGGMGLIAAGEVFNENDDRYGTAWTSVDGATWSESWFDAVGANAEAEFNVVDIHDAGPGFVAVGWDGRVDRTIVYTSVDGQTWTRTTEEQHGLDGDVRRVIDTGDGFVAVGWRHEPRPPVYPDDAAVWTSADGVTWRTTTDDTLRGPGLGINDIVETEAALVAVGLAGYERDAHDTTTAAVWVMERP